MTEAGIYARPCKRTSTLGYRKIKAGNGFLDLTAGYPIILNPMAAPPLTLAHPEADEALKAAQE